MLGAPCLGLRRLKQHAFTLAVTQQTASTVLKGAALRSSSAVNTIIDAVPEQHSVRHVNARPGPAFLQVLRRQADDHLPTQDSSSRVENASLDQPRASIHPIRDSAIKSKSTDVILSETTNGAFIEDSNRVLRSKHLKILARSNCASDAWRAYTGLLQLPCPHRERAELPNIPFFLLHRLSRLLIKVKPRTRDLFLRLLSVLRTIHDTGGTVHLDEWNALILCAGRGWRKTRLEEFRVAIGIYNDMITHKAPGTALLEGHRHPSKALNLRNDAVKPDIVTYTTLLTIAGDTGESDAMRQAASLIKASGLAPNRVTHLTMLRYFTKTAEISGFHSTMVKMKQQGLDIGLDGLNASMILFGRNNRPDVAFMIYCVLRRNLDPKATTKWTVNDDEVTEFLLKTQHITVPENLVPNEITYISMIQILAIHGHLTLALTVFEEMLGSIDKTILFATTNDHNCGDAKNCSPIITAFRALFLGFSKHGCTKKSRGSTSLEGGSPWTLENLNAIFQGFLETPVTCKRPDRGLLYWILAGFMKTSGNDVKLMREVWLKLEGKFPGRWAGTGHRLERLRMRLFPRKATSVRVDME